MTILHGKAQISCPICRTLHKNVNDLRRHLLSNHPHEAHRYMLDRTTRHKIKQLSEEKLVEAALDRLDISPNQLLEATVYHDRINLVVKPMGQKYTICR